MALDDDGVYIPGSGGEGAPDGEGDTGTGDGTGEDTNTSDGTGGTVDPGASQEISLPDIPTEGVLAKTGAAYDKANVSILDNVGKSYDVDYNDPTIPDSLAPESGSSYVTPESTVAGQLTKLLDKDSDYIKQAEAKARIGAQNLGLASSSMAEGAARGAAIERGLPIAQQDAQTYGKHNLQQQQAEVNQSQAAVEGLVSGALNEQKYDLIDRSQALASTFEVAIKAADAESAVALRELKGQWDFALADSIKRLEYYLQKDLNEHTVDDQKAENVRLMSADLIKNNQIAIENLLKDPDMLQLGPEVYGQLVNNMTAMTTKSIQFLYNSSGLDMDGSIETLLAAYEGDVTWGDALTNPAVVPEDTEEVIA